MSHRHMHITSFISDTSCLRVFLDAARSLGIFQQVQPLVRDDGRVSAVAFWSKDLDDIGDELAMPEAAAKLSGILHEDVVIVSAWCGDYLPADRERERVWRVPGFKTG